ncbi:MAG: cytochrome c family protein, partial [Brevundimonas sp.]
MSILTFLRPQTLAAPLMAGCTLMLAACGSGTETADKAPAPPKRPEPTQEQKLALLAALPAPYNAGDLENGRRVFARCRSCH